MIRKLSDSTASSIWSIYGEEISLWKRKNISEDKMIKMIIEYKEVLRSRYYEVNNEPLCKQFVFWGGIPFISVGFNAFEELFVQMFQYFTKEFVLAWVQSNKVLRSKEVGINGVFERMLCHPDFDIKYDFRYILDGNDKRRILYDIVEKEFASYWANEINTAIDQEANFCEISKRIGIIRVTRYAMMTPDKVGEYLQELVHSFTKRRERISFHKVHQSLFDNNYKSNGQDKYDETFKILIHDLVQKEYVYQYEHFPKTNQLEMNMNKDRWILYSHHGPSLVFNEVNFLEIKSPSLRQEMKYYIRHRYEPGVMIKDRFVSGISTALNMLVDNRPSLHYFADMDEVDAKSLHLALEAIIDLDEAYMSTTKIMGIFSKLKVVTRYLMSEHRDPRLKSPVPTENIFEQYRFINSKDYVTNTPVMPECVVERLNEVVHELNERDQLIFKIFSNTGLRTKEVLFLEADCIETTRYDELMAIRYKPYKVINSRKKHQLSEYNRVMVSTELADEILAFIKSTANERLSHGFSYIFVNNRKGHKPAMMKMPYYVSKINALISKHKITDEFEQLWHFTNRQYRKTLAVTLIENGATVEELAYWLGHLNRDTAAKYYAEVRAKKLEEMNTAFFKEQFELLLSGEQLLLFNEEERQLLYVDFRLDQRRVEYGHCLRKRSEGECNKRNSLYHCIFCNQLCTGKKYIDYWSKLLKEQTKRFQVLVESYVREGIDDYLNYKEYLQEKKLLEGFRSIVATIIERGDD